MYPDDSLANHHQLGGRAHVARRATCGREGIDAFGGLECETHAVFSSAGPGIGIAGSRLARRGTAVCIALFALALAAGCEDDGSEAAARAALERVVAGDGAGLCDYLSEAALARLQLAEDSVVACRDEYASHALGEGPADAEVAVEGSSQSGDGVVVDAKIGPTGDQQGVQVTLVQEGASWKVDEVEYEAAAAAAVSAKAKNLSRAAQAALETYAVDNGGSYEGATMKELVQLSPILEGADFELKTTVDGYRVGARSELGATFSIVRRADGEVELRCSPPGTSDCPDSGDWGT